MKKTHPINDEKRTDHRITVSFGERGAGMNESHWVEIADDLNIIHIPSFVTCEKMHQLLIGKSNGIKCYQTRNTEKIKCSSSC